MNPYATLIHQLNQRCYREWKRAELLARERNRSFGLIPPWLFFALRSAKRLVWPTPADEATAQEGAFRPVAESPEIDLGMTSIIIPFRDQPDLLRGCLKSLRSTLGEFEIILVDNGSRLPRTERLLQTARRHFNRLRIVRSPGEFNFSQVCNEGAAVARGERLLFLNNDTEILSEDWLVRMTGLLQLPDVGVVGSLLRYPDGTIQHAGLFPRADGRWVHSRRHGSHIDSHPRFQTPHEVPAVSGACLLVHSHDFRTIGGFDCKYPLTYGDVDLCLKLRDLGKRVVLTPLPMILHYEGLTRGWADDAPREAHLQALQAFPTLQG
jgi:GT2 family glycosyltransferase